MRTVAEPVVGSEIRVEPSDDPGIRINGTPATLDHVQKADVRVDLLGDERSFVAEHALGPLGLCGVTAAEVTGVRDTWSFARPEHRFCYSCGLAPANVVGHPAGLPNPAVAEAIGDVGVVEQGTPVRRSVADTVRFDGRDGHLELQPRDQATGIRLDISFRGEDLVAEVDPAGHTDSTLVERVTNATTPYLTDDPREGITHAVADVVSDVAVLGGFEDLLIRGELGEAYHSLTIGAARKAHDVGVVVER